MSSMQRRDDSDATSRADEAIARVRETVLEPILDALEPVFDALEPVIEPVANSVLLKLATMGVVLFALGAILNEGVWAAILGVWGGGLILVGLSLYGFIWWRRN